VKNKGRTSERYAFAVNFAPYVDAKRNPAYFALSDVHLALFSLYALLYNIPVVEVLNVHE
jgi:hypothetical protein